MLASKSSFSPQELGASSVTPLLTERSPSISENRVDRLQRVILAAVKQCRLLVQNIFSTIWFQDAQDELVLFFP